MLINFPAIAYRTFKTLKDTPPFSGIYKSLLKKLKITANPIQRARLTHHEIDKHIKTVEKNPVVQEMLSCKKGCSACCHTQVSINSDEAELLASRLYRDVEIDLKKLYLQSECRDNAGKWYQLPYELRGCVFLDENNGCKIYDDRPSVCRTNMVISDASSCDTRDGSEKSVRLVNTQKADMAMIASYTVARDAGSLPYMLWKSLHKKKKSEETNESSEFNYKKSLQRAHRAINKIFPM